MSWHGTGDDTKLVFTTATGRPIEARNIYRSFQRILRQYNLRPIKLHGLRHTNATTQDLQVHPRDIQAILGHSDVRTTGIYSHVGMDSKRGALSKVEAQFFSAGADATNSGGIRQTEPSSQVLAMTRAPDVPRKRKHPPLVGGWNSWWLLPDSNWGHKALQRVGG
jgi:hypothetical protein